MRDPVTGKTQKQDPLSKTNLSNKEMDEILNCDECIAWSFFNEEDYDF